jgi:tight adherence protein B
MQFDPTMLVYGAVILASIAFVAGLYFLVAGLRGSDAEIISRRLDDLSNLAAEQRKHLLRRKSLSDGKSAWLAALLETASLRSFDTLVATSGIRMSTDRILFLAVIAAAVIFELLDLVGGFSLIICAVGGLLLGGVAPLLWIINLRRRRMARITAQLPDAIDMLVRSMRAGHPVATGVGLVAREMDAPIGTEFARVFDEMSYGMDLRQAFEKMSDRLGLLEINYMIAAMRIQSTTGGNLAEVLAALSSVMREKIKLKAKVKALSAEARFSGIILSALPIVVVLLLLYMNPHYYDLAETSDLLKGILAAAAVLMFVGIILIRKFSTIRI